MATDAAVDDRECRRRAIAPERSFIVQAPAGSGKTSLLTLRYLRLLAVVERPEEIVAITFTRKAASEMRHRIVAALAAASQPPAADAGEHDVDSHRLATAALARSRALGWGLECNPARLHVQTIDGLNHWLARRLPLAARIGLSAALVDDAAALYAEAARRLALRLEGDHPVAPLIERLVRALNHEPRLLSRLVEDMLGSRELWLPKLLDSTNGTSLRVETDRLLQSALEVELARIARSLAALDVTPLFDLIRDAAPVAAAGTPVALLLGLRELPPATAAAVPQWLALAELLLTGDRAGAVRKTVGARQGFPPAAGRPRAAAVKRRMTGLLTDLAARADFASTLVRVRCLPPARLTDAQWERIDALRVVLPHAVAELLALFAERGRLDHAAVAAAARAALGDPSAPSDLALALDYRVRHLLVDEYQDTSPAQERLLELLVRGWQAGDGRSLFCVGDPMQSIYAFREADVTLFLQAQRQGIGGVPLAALRLGCNFRSCAALVSWINATFARLLPAEDDFERGAVRYSAARAVLADGPGTGVQVHPLFNADGAEMGATVARLAADALAAAPRDRPPSIAVLVRARASLPPLLAALRHAGIEYRGVELESLGDRSAIRDLVALVKAMLHAGDRSAWLAVLRAPWCGLSLADLHELAAQDADLPVPLRMHQAALSRSLSADGATRLARLSACLLQAIAARSGRFLGSWLKAAWLALGGPATVGDPSDLANAELLFAALDTLELEAGPTPSAAAIDAAVRGIKASPVGGESAGVQLMTIHRAKGLQFDVVILPDLQRSVRGAERPLLYWTTIATAPGRRGIVLASRGADDGGGGTDGLEQWMQRLSAERETFELGRIAYVAATRACRELHLIGSAGLAGTAGTAALKDPPSGSLLGFFWPVLRADFERALALRAASDAEAKNAARSRPRLTAPPLQRLVDGFQHPPLPPAPRPHRLLIVSEPQGSIRPEFDWAGAIAQASGQVVHEELHRLARAGRPPSGLAARPAAWRRRLRDLGVDEAHLPQAFVRVERALALVSQSTIAGRLLDPSSAEATSELALTAVQDGVVHSVRIDRSFVDATGVRWIVDWKTSAHEGGNVEAFLDNELSRYAPQLRRYAAVLRRIDGRRQKVGLYFPLLDAWRELPPAP